MGRIQLTPQLRGDIGELYFKHLCYQRGYAFIKLEAIYKSFMTQDILEFRFKYKRILIQIPEPLIEEIRRVCQPLDFNGSKSYVFDFFTCKLGKDRLSFDDVNVRDRSNFNWVEVKTGSNHLTYHQNEIRHTCKIPFNVFRVRDIMVAPNNVIIKYDETELA